MNLVLWLHEQDIPTDDTCCVFFSVGNVTEKSITREAALKCMIFQKMILGSLMYLGQYNMIKHAHIFVFVYAISLFT